MMLVKKLQQLLVEKESISLLTVPLMLLGSISYAALVSEYRTCFLCQQKLSQVWIF